MRFLTWNIQSGGGRRVASIVGELSQLAADFIALTEVTYNNLDVLRHALARQGFDHIETTCSAGQANSVLVASKAPFRATEEPVAHDSERWLSVEIDSLDLKILCVHIPGSTDNKFDGDGFGLSGKKRKELFWDQVIQYAQRHKDERAIILGDFNTGLPEDAEGTPFELSDRIRILRLEKWTDAWRSLNPKAREYTWYSKRKNKELGTSEDLNGFRLDYLFVSNALRDSTISAEHVHRVRKEGVSDHAILVADLSVGDSVAVESSELGPALQRPPDYRDGWGELVRAHRFYMGISKDCLAERLKISERSLADIEVERRACPPGFLDSVLKVIKEFDAEVEKLIRSATGSGEHELIPVEVTADDGGEWARAVIGRAAVQSGLLIPFRPGRRRDNWST